MDTTKIIKGIVNGRNYTVTSPIVKEDYGLYLKIEGVELPPTYQVDFSNSENNGTSVTMIGNADGVLIPHQFIDTGKDIFAFLYHVGANYGRTVYKFRIPNKVRPDRTDDTPTPEEQSVIDQAISALNTAVAQTAQDKADADVSAQNASADAERAEEARTDAQNYATQAEQARDDAQTYANNASASATASANSASASAQIKSDVEDLVDDAQASASASANSASQASGYAQSASASAQSASGYASNAQTSANTASNKASEASTSAQTASNKASESAQSASQALSYKTDAESAKTASQTAQGLAESARDSAISAKNDAESAKDDAESARDEAQSIVDGISGALDDKAPVITDTASGAIASFSDGADNLPLKSLVVNIDPVQDTSSGDPSPENICPISGWTGAKVARTGKNILGGLELYNAMKATFTNSTFDDANHTVTSTPSQASGKKIIDIRFKANTAYTIIVKFSNNAVTSAGDGCPNIAFRYTDGSNTSLSVPSYTANQVVVAAFVSNPTKTLDMITGSWNTGTATIYCDNTGIFEGDVAVGDYTAYVGTTIPISWQTEAGIVYGGTIDVVSGVMRVDRAMAIFDGTEPFRNNWFPTVVCTKEFPKGDADGNSFVNSHIPSLNNACTYATSGKTTFQFGKVNEYWGVSSADELKAIFTQQYANETPITICYPLAEPIEIQLDAHTINSLYGVNNIFADTGDTEVEYRADTKLYIERLTAPDSADMIADANIVSGQYFMVGNTLYKATANIANGGQITVGTNCTRVSLAQALNEINA